MQMVGARLTPTREDILKAQDGDPLKLVWVKRPDARKPGWQSAYAITLYGVGDVAGDGSWYWNGHDGSPHERGVEESVLAAKFEIQQRWDRMVESWRARKPMTAKQLEDAYRKRLIGRIRSADSEDHYSAISAIDALSRNGWLDKCPTINESWIGYMPPMMILDLKAAGKLPPFEDVV